MTSKASSFCFILSAVICFASVKSHAKEGMWIPTLLQAVEGDMQSMGMHISAEDIYSINAGSLKDAIVHFNGGCTAEMISSEGLLLTNHHCGFSQIAFHSTVENDYLTDGFWAMNRAEELINPKLVATFIHRIVDVTDSLLGIEDLEFAKQKLIDSAIGGTDLEGKVVAFDFGNSHYLITTRTYRDVRLVGAPPSAVGKFGGDTDNWVWPRHTGDFSMFRIYADAENNPADYDEANVPYRPAHHFPINIGGVEEGDFMMVFGFPGTTEQYLTHDAVEHVVDRLNPIRIAMRDASLSVINAARSESPAMKIAYADKQSSVANAWKKWIGQNKGLLELDASGQKVKLEAEFSRRASDMGHAEWASLFSDIETQNEMFFPLQEARSLFIELAYYGPDALNFAMAFKPLIEDWDALEESGDLEGQLMETRELVAGHFRQYDAQVDESILAALLPPYVAAIQPDLCPDVLKDFDGDGSQLARSLYAKSVFANRNLLENLLNKGQSKGFSRLKKDPIYKFIQSVRSAYFVRVADDYRATKVQLDSLTGQYTTGLRVLFPGRAFFPDANSTMRLTYGKVEGSSPYDGMHYKPFSTAKGILQKYVPGDPDFDLPMDLVEDLRLGNWGDYANESGELPVCFTGSNHTTGGNSGSPAIDGDGHLVGINFDRSWESTMSDILFDETRCRNIMVDIRYVLWITDVYAGAHHLVEEMDLVR